MNQREKFNQKLKEYILEKKACGFRLVEIANEIGVSYSMLSLFLSKKVTENMKEKAKRENEKGKKMKEIASEMGISPALLSFALRGFSISSQYRICNKLGIEYTEFIT